MVKSWVGVWCMHRALTHSLVVSLPPTKVYVCQTNKHAICQELRSKGCHGQYASPFLHRSFSTKNKTIHHFHFSPPSPLLIQFIHSTSLYKKHDHTPSLHLPSIISLRPHDLQACSLVCYQWSKVFGLHTWSQFTQVSSLTRSWHNSSWTAQLRSGRPLSLDAIVWNLCWGFLGDWSEGSSVWYHTHRRVGAFSRVAVE